MLVRGFCKQERFEVGQETSCKTNLVWQYFDLGNENKVVCRMYQNNMAYNHLNGVICNHIQSKFVNLLCKERRLLVLALLMLATLLPGLQWPACLIYSATI